MPFFTSESNTQSYNKAAAEQVAKCLAFETDAQMEELCTAGGLDYVMCPPWAGPERDEAMNKMWGFAQEAIRRLVPFPDTPTAELGSYKTNDVVRFILHERNQARGSICGPLLVSSVDTIVTKLVTGDGSFAEAHAVGEVMAILLRNPCVAEHFLPDGMMKMTLSLIKSEQPSRELKDACRSTLCAMVLETSARMVKDRKYRNIIQDAVDPGVVIEGALDFIFFLSGTGTAADLPAVASAGLLLAHFTESPEAVHALIKPEILNLSFSLMRGELPQKSKSLDFGGLNPKYYQRKGEDGEPVPDDYVYVPAEQLRYVLDFLAVNELRRVAFTSKDWFYNVVADDEQLRATMTQPTFDADVQNAGMRLIGNVIRSEDDAHTDLVVEMGVVDHLAAMLAAAEPEDVKSGKRRTHRGATITNAVVKEVVWQLSNIAAGTEPQIEKMLPLESMWHQLIRMCLQDNVGIAKEASYCISNVIQISNNENNFARRCLDMGLLPGIIAGCTIPKKDVMGNCMQTLLDNLIPDFFNADECEMLWKELYKGDTLVFADAARAFQKTLEGKGGIAGYDRGERNKDFNWYLMAVALPSFALVEHSEHFEEALYHQLEFTGLGDVWRTEFFTEGDAPPFDDHDEAERLAAFAADTTKAPTSDVS